MAQPRSMFQKIWDAHVVKRDPRITVEDRLTVCNMPIEAGATVD